MFGGKVQSGLESNIASWRAAFEAWKPKYRTVCFPHTCGHDRFQTATHMNGSLHRQGKYSTPDRPIITASQTIGNAKPSSTSPIVYEGLLGLLVPHQIWNLDFNVKTPFL